MFVVERQGKQNRRGNVFAPVDGEHCPRSQSQTDAVIPAITQREKVLLINWTQKLETRKCFHGLEMAMVDQNLRRREEGHGNFLADFHNVRKATMDGPSLVYESANGRHINEKIRQNSCVKKYKTIFPLVQRK